MLIDLAYCHLLISNNWFQVLRVRLIFDLFRSNYWINKLSGQENYKNCNKCNWSIRRFLENALKRHNSTWHQRCHHRTKTIMYTLFSVLCLLPSPLSSIPFLHWCLSSILCFFCPGSKAAPRPGGIGSAAAGQPGMEGDSMLSKILPGGAAEQAGKLGEGMTNKSLDNSKL